MIDFARLRRTMVDGQVRVNDVTDARIIEAMLELPRERFVPKARAELAYIDNDVPVREAEAGRPARHLMEPMALAKLVQALELGAEERALDVGCASGYSSALLARLGREVVALEEDETLVSEAKRLLAALQVGNAKIVAGKLPKGVPEFAPYDAILINGSVEVVPAALLDQLGEGGRLAAVVQSGSLGRARLYVRSGGSVSHRTLFDAGLPALPGFEAPRSFVF